jgi:NAD(P)-dependent dehydrogenase (short-subunit alcohol dehydrogenase family)
MKEQGNGSIINITSINAERGFSDNPAYIASKGGLKQLTKSLAMDLGKFGVRANAIGPGYFRTQISEKSWNDPEKRRERAETTFLNRWGQLDDLSGLVIFLASDASSYITGQDIYIDGGFLMKGI